MTTLDTPPTARIALNLWLLDVPREQAEDWETVYVIRNQ